MSHLRYALPLSFFALLVSSGCLPKAPRMSRDNKIQVHNNQREPVERVVIKWKDREFKFDPRKSGDSEFSNISKSISLVRDVDANMKIEVYYSGEAEPVVHEEKIQLKMDEAKKVSINILKGKKISIKEKKTNPNIQ